MTNLPIEVKAKGLCRIQLKDVATGEIRLDTGDFDNTLLDNFFKADGYAFLRAHACTDATVNVTDTSMSSIGATNTVDYSAGTPEISGSLITTSMVNVFTFAAGSVVGNLSCIALLSTTTDASIATTLRVKTLVKDVNGDPTTIPVTAADQLIVTHTLKFTVDQHPASFVANIDGTNHTFQFMASRIDTPSKYGIYGFAPFAISFTQSVFTGCSVTVAADATDITIGVINTNIALTNPVNLGDAYTTDFSQATSGKMKTIVSKTMPASTNLSGNAGIGFIGVGMSSSFASRTYSGFKITPALPKDANIAYTFTVTFTLSR